MPGVAARREPVWHVDAGILHARQGILLVLEYPPTRARERASMAVFERGLMVCMFWLLLRLNDDWIVSRVPSVRQEKKLNICKLEGEGNSKNGTWVGEGEGEMWWKGLMVWGLRGCLGNGRGCPDCGRFAPLWEVELDGKRGRR